MVILACDLRATIVGSQAASSADVVEMVESIDGLLRCHALVWEAVAVECLGCTVSSATILWEKATYRVCVGRGALIERSIVLGEVFVHERGLRNEARIEFEYLFIYLLDGAVYYCCQHIYLSCVAVRTCNIARP